MKPSWKEVPGKRPLGQRSPWTQTLLERYPSAATAVVGTYSTGMHSSSYTLKKKLDYIYVSLLGIMASKCSRDYGL